jgi:hypothetical protein
MDYAEQNGDSARASLSAATSLRPTCVAARTGATGCPTGARIGADATLDPLRREMLTGLSRTRIDVAFISQLLNEAGDAHSSRAIAVFLRRLDDMIEQLSNIDHPLDR